ncbi:Gfo/Idh/MocA family protein [Aurantimicrobium sp. MWH-Uga1]|uniref:Gfo/Idh/MocA family protein n=1 Tax=Aurantimicrobium sp. MWH-Uga1 TaxID=2079575 RepID=UPI0013B04AD0|nr:Gfo/Idh/MocA family oxidoreductase [Aurantimicrobium sp. MWH-Uga1]
MSLQIPPPVVIRPESAPILRWGMFGTGWISEEFATSTMKHTSQDIVTIASRTPGKAQIFAESHGLPEWDESYESLAAREDIDAVYIATRPRDHLEHALIAINAGKHVLIEKPIATTPSDAQEIFDAASKQGVFAMEAMWNRYLPQASIVRQILENNLIGKPQLMLVDFCQDQRQDPRKWDPHHGTIMLDMGIYPVAFALEIMGDPTRVQAIGKLNDHGAEAEVTVVMDFANSARAIFTVSGLTHAPHHATIAGDQGIIEYKTPFVVPSGISLLPSGFNQKGQAWEDTNLPQGHQGLCYQATAFAHYVGAGMTESPVHSHQESVRALEIVEDILRQIGVTYLQTTSNKNMSYEYTSHRLL